MEKLPEKESEQPGEAIKRFIDFLKEADESFFRYPDEIDYTLWCHTRASFELIKRDLNLLSSSEAIEMLKAIVEAIEKSQMPEEEKSKRINELVKSFFGYISTLERYEKFLDSPFREKINPFELIEKAVSVGCDDEFIKQLIKESGYETKLGELFIYGSEELKDKLLKIFSENEIKQSAKEELEKYCKKETEEAEKTIEAILKHKNGIEMPLTSYILEPGHGVFVVELILKSAKRGIFLDNYEGCIQKIIELYKCFEKLSPKDRSVKEEIRQIEEMKAKIEALIGKKPEKITGKGLEFVSTSHPEIVRVYLDGELVGCLANATFSKKATNGEVVAWLTSETINRDPVKGVQVKDTVWIWKKGWEEPKPIFEDSAWSCERCFKIFPPEVSPDGEIQIKEIVEGNLIEQTLEPE